MAEAAVNLAFLGVTSYLVGRDIYGYLPSFPRTSPTRAKRFRGGEPHATVSMDDEVCDPAAQPPRPSRHSGLPRAVRAQVKACCETLLEAKYVEEAVSGAVPTVATTPRVTCLNDIGQGTAANNRVGNKIICKYLQIEGILFLDANAASDYYRLAVVIDHECFGAICTWGQYVQGTPTNSVYSLPSMETVGKGRRFTTLVDRLIPINNDVGTTNGAAKLQTFSLKVPLNFSTHYNGNAGTVSDIVRNSICVIEGSQGGIVQARWISRVVYLDG